MLIVMNSYYNILYRYDLGARKTSYAFRGTEGVIVYHIKDQNKCLALMWKVPYSRSNGWYIKVYDGFINPNKDLFHEMRDKSHMGGDGKIYEGTLDGGLCYSGSMGGTGKPHVEIILQYCSSKNETR
ncbi:Sea anemone cytolysin [Gigaspora margarita]|uniref:Sea anemone cytolysin n=1 Tax=Gigaspora margarita TaxID=4874 RepID=A0A8H4EJH7_GIGMA|nr:Sea anemone cytolysin [Gigaspora margarita]